MKFLLKICCEIALIIFCFQNETIAQTESVEDSDSELVDKDYAYYLLVERNDSLLENEFKQWIDLNPDASDVDIKEFFARDTLEVGCWFLSSVKSSDKKITAFNFGWQMPSQKSPAFGAFLYYPTKEGMQWSGCSGSTVLEILSVQGINKPIYLLSERYLSWWGNIRTMATYALLVDTLIPYNGFQYNYLGLLYGQKDGAIMQVPYFQFNYSGFCLDECDTMVTYVKYNDEKQILSYSYPPDEELTAKKYFEAYQDTNCPVISGSFMFKDSLFFFQNETVRLVPCDSIKEEEGY